MQGVREDDKVRIQEFDVGTVINYIPANPSAVYRLGGGHYAVIFVIVLLLSQVVLICRWLG